MPLNGCVQNFCTLLLPRLPDEAPSLSHDFPRVSRWCRTKTHMMHSTPIAMHARNQSRVPARICFTNSAIISGYVIIWRPPLGGLWLNLRNFCFALSSSSVGTHIPRQRGFLFTWDPQLKRYWGKMERPPSPREMSPTKGLAPKWCLPATFARRLQVRQPCLT